MRKKKNNLKRRWIDDISNFEIGWNRDWRKMLLHPHDVKSINQEFHHLKMKIKKQRCTRENEKIYFYCLCHIYQLVSKANQRMTTMCDILNDLLSIK
jgi:hypothetical protein